MARKINRYAWICSPLLILVALPITTNAQSPAAILEQCELAYQQCNKLSDSGFELQFNYQGISHGPMIQTNYQITFGQHAMHYVANIIKKDSTIRLQYSRSGYDTKGKYFSSTSPDTLILPLRQAAFKAMMESDGAFYHLCALRYPDIVTPPTGKSSLLNADTIYQLPDTLINEQPCYTIRTVSGYFPTYEMVASLRNEYDSLIQINPKSRLLHKFQYPPVAQTITYVYTIRKADHLIIRMDGRMYDGIDLATTTAMRCDPVCEP